MMHTAVLLEFVLESSHSQNCPYLPAAQLQMPHWRSPWLLHVGEFGSKPELPCWSQGHSHMISTSSFRVSVSELGFISIVCFHSFLSFGQFTALMTAVNSSFGLLRRSLHSRISCSSVPVHLVK